MTVIWYIAGLLLMLLSAAMAVLFSGEKLFKVKLKNLYKSIIFNEGQSCGLSSSALVIVTMLYVFTVASVGKYQIIPFIPLAAYPVFLAVSTDLPYKDIGRKLLVASPFVIFIGIWNPYFDTAEIELFGAVFSRGWISFLSIILKFLLTVSATLLMIATVGFDKICRSLALFGFPEVLVTQFFLLNRYIRLLSDETHNIIRAWVFRGGKITLKNAGNICGPLLLRSISRSRRIHSALMCRGYHGCLYNNHGTQKLMTGNDMFFTFSWAVFFVAVRFVNLPEFLWHIISRCLI